MKIWIVAITIAALTSGGLGCGGSNPRETTLNITMASLNAADLAFNAFEKQREIDIGAGAGKIGAVAGEAQLVAFRAQRDKARAALEAALKALSDAWKLNDQPSLDAAVATFKSVQTALDALGLKI